jgi:hypothetical protein
VIAPQSAHAGASVFTNAIFWNGLCPPFPLVVGEAITFSSV